MIRSLIAILAATLIGLTTAKFIEGAGQALIEESASVEGVQTDPSGYGAVLVIAWTIGAFAAASCALLVGRRWAPLGYLASATIFLSAAIGLMSAALGWMMWPLSVVASALGGFLAVKLYGATMAYPEKTKRETFFDD